MDVPPFEARKHFREMKEDNDRSVKSEFVPRDLVFDLLVSGSVQLGQHVGFQITASGFHQVRFGYAPCASQTQSGARCSAVSLIVTLTSRNRQSAANEPRPN